MGQTGHPADGPEDDSSQSVGRRHGPQPVQPPHHPTPHGHDL